MASCEDISGSCDCLYFFWVCKASVVSTESTRRIRNDVANAAVRHGGENESRIRGTVSTESASDSVPNKIVKTAIFISTPSLAIFPLTVLASLN